MFFGLDAQVLGPWIYFCGSERWWNWLDVGLTLAALTANQNCVTVYIRQSKHLSARAACIRNIPESAVLLFH